MGCMWGWRKPTYLRHSKETRGKPRSLVPDAARMTLQGWIRSRRQCVAADIGDMPQVRNGFCLPIGQAAVAHYRVPPWDVCNLPPWDFLVSSPCREQEIKSGAWLRQSVPQTLSLPFPSSTRGPLSVTRSLSPIHWACCMQKRMARRIRVQIVCASLYIEQY